VRRAALLFNPRAGQHRTKRLDAIRAELVAGGWSLEFRATESPEHCRELALGAVEEGLDALFVLGGDGTLRVAASALAGSGVALGALPGGTTNVVALALGLPFDPVAAARRLAAGAPRRFDLGRAGEDLFLMQLSGGLDARVLAAVDPRLKRRIGKGAVLVAGLREWRRYDFPLFELDVDGRSVTATGFVAANLAEYGGRLRIVPDARADDGRLDLLLFRGQRRRDVFRFALDLLRERHVERDDVELVTASRVRLLSAAGGALQLDGDPYVPSLPLAIGLAAASIDLLVPPSA